MCLHPYKNTFHNSDLTLLYVCIRIDIYSQLTHEFAWGGLVNLSKVQNEYDYLGSSFSFYCIVLYIFLCISLFLTLFAPHGWGISPKIQIFDNG